MVTKVVFTGRQGVGKDTTIFGVAHKLKMLGYDIEVINEMARDAWYRGFKLSSETTVPSQLYILGKQLCVEAFHNEKSKADFILYNRSMLDCVAVSRLVLSKEVADWFEEAILALLHLNPYDLILQFQPFQEEVPDDKVRDVNPEFIAKVQKAFEDLAYKLLACGYNVKFINVRKQSIDDICDIILGCAKPKLQT